MTASPEPSPWPCRRELGGGNSPLARKVARLFVVRASGCWSDGQRDYPRWEADRDTLRQQLRQLGVGGVILLGGSAVELRQRISWIERQADHPLLLCADVEEGVGQRFAGASWLPPPLSLGRLYRSNPERALKLARRYGAAVGLEARAVGLNWVLAPCCDVNSNPRNPVINVRAFSDEPEAAAALVHAFQQGLGSSGVLGCAKHFPGHGDTAQDSHLLLPELAIDGAQLERRELPPFCAALAADCPAVMAAHLLVPLLDAERPAGFSSTILAGLLRQRLGFDGAIVSDALTMAAASREDEDPALAALAAGCDLLLMPPALERSIVAICAAIHDGRLSEARVDQALARRQGLLDRLAGNSTPAPLTALQGKDVQGLERELVEADLDCRGGPMAHWQGRGVNLLLLDDPFNTAPLPATAAARTRPGAMGLEPLLWPLRQPLPPLRGVVLVQLWLRGHPFRGNAEAEGSLLDGLQFLQRQGQLRGLALYGNPWQWPVLLEALPGLPMAFCCAGTPAAQAAAMARLLPSPDTAAAGAAFTD